MLTPRAAVCFFFSIYLSLFLSHIYRRLHVCPHISSTREEDRREIRDAIDVFLLVWTLLHSKCPLIGDSWCVDLYLFTLYTLFLNPALTKGCISYHVLWSEQSALSVSQLLFHTLRNLGTWHSIYSERGESLTVNQCTNGFIHFLSTLIWVLGGPEAITTIVW